MMKFRHGHERRNINTGAVRMWCERDFGGETCLAWAVVLPTLWKRSKLREWNRRELERTIVEMAARRQAERN
jgi:hypothetical protein